MSKAKQSKKVKRSLRTNKGGYEPKISKEQRKARVEQKRTERKIEMRDFHYVQVTELPEKSMPYADQKALYDLFMKEQNGELS